MTTHAHDQETATTDAFPLLDLPYVPLLRVLRYFDKNSLIKAQWGCKSLFSFIDDNRRKMVRTCIGKVTISKVRNPPAAQGQESQNLAADMPLIQCIVKKSVKRTYYFPAYFLSMEELETLEVLEKEIHHDKIIWKMPWEWMAHTFTNVFIGGVFLKQIHFSEEEISYLEKELSKNKIYIDEVDLRDTIHSALHATRILRLLTVLPTASLHIHEKDPRVSSLIASPSFLNYICTLAVAFENMALDYNPEAWDGALEVPSHVYKLPPICRLGLGFVLPVATLRKALHEWYHDRFEIVDWFCVMPTEYADKERFFFELALPYEEVYDETLLRKRSKITNCVGKELLVDAYGFLWWDYENHERLSLWCIADEL